jgi:hypothetical protein
VKGKEGREGGRRQAGPEKTTAAQKGPPKAGTAAALATLPALAPPGRAVHAVAAYHGPAPRPPAREPHPDLPDRNAARYDLAPPRTGKRGRPRTRGARPGEPGDITETCARETRTIRAYGRDQVKHAAEIPCLWHGPLRTAPVRLTVSRDEDTTEGHDRALVTTAMTAGPAALAARHATRRETGQAPGDARNVPGAGEARTRARRAAGRTVRSPCPPRRSPSPGTPGTATTPPASTTAPRTSPGTPARPSPPPRTRSPTSAAS